MFRKREVYGQGNGKQFSMSKERQVARVKMELESQPGARWSARSESLASILLAVVG